VPKLYWKAYIVCAAVDIGAWLSQRCTYTPKKGTDPKRIGFGV